MKPGRFAILAWLAALGLGALLAARTHYTADLSAFLPASPNATQRLLVEQLSEGPVSRVLLLAIEGADAQRRLQLSAALAALLRREPRFTFVSNGADWPADGEFLLAQRYLLSDATTPDHYTVAGLRSAIDDSLATLSSPAGLLLADLLDRDPTGEMTQLALQLQRDAQPRSERGLWISRDGARALLVVRTRASGSDTDAQESAIAALRAAFAGLAPRDAALVVSGPGVFAVEARATIVREALRLSILGSVLTLALLLFVYRSAFVLLIGMLPVLSGALAGVAAVAAGFGVVHGLTLGFGVTLIGEAVDYAIYLFVQLGAGSGAVPRREWFRDYWPTIRLGMLTSVCGFAALLFSGFPGLAQLGLYSVAGLIAAALVTRHVLPAILPEGFRVRDIAWLGAGLQRVTARLQSSWVPRVLVLLLSLCALLLLLARGEQLWNRELSSLSPVALADQQRDADLRADLGAPEVRDVIVVSGADREQVLERVEQLDATLSALVDAGALGGFDSPARFLPSLATQQRRREALPPEDELRARLSAALVDSPLRSERLAPFIADVGEARSATPITMAALQGTSFAAAVDSLLLETSQGWRAMLPLRAATDLPAVQAALTAAGVTGVQLLDLKTEADSLYDVYLHETARLAVLGLLALFALLLIALRSPRRALRVFLPLLLAVVCTAACLVALGRQLTLLHIVGLLLIVAIGSNYALFFDGAARAQASGAGLASPQTFASVLLACTTSVLGFGVLAFSTVPVMQALGETVAPGGVLALCYAAVFAARPRASA